MGAPRALNVRYGHALARYGASTWSPRFSQLIHFHIAQKPQIAQIEPNRRSRWPELQNVPQVRSIPVKAPLSVSGQQSQTHSTKPTSRSPRGRLEI